MNRLALGGQPEKGKYVRKPFSTPEPAGCIFGGTRAEFDDTQAAVIRSPELLEANVPAR